MSQRDSDHNQSSSNTLTPAATAITASKPATTTDTTTAIDPFAFLFQPMADYGCSILDVPPAQLQQQLEKFEDPVTLGSYLQDLTNISSHVEHYPTTTMSTMELLHYSLPAAPEPTTVTGAEMPMSLMMDDPNKVTSMSSQQQYQQQQQQQFQPNEAVPSISASNEKAGSLCSLLKYFPDLTKFMGHNYFESFVKLWFSFQKCILLARNAECRTWVTRELWSITEHLDMTVEKIMNERKQMEPQYHQHEDCEQQTPFLIYALQSLKDRVEVMHRVMLIIETARIQYNQDPVSAIIPILHRIIEKRQNEKQQQGLLLQQQQLHQLQQQHRSSEQKQGQQVSDMMTMILADSTGSSSSGGTTFMQQDYQQQQLQQGSAFNDPTMFVQPQHDYQQQMQHQHQQEFYQNPAMAAMMLQSNNNRNVYCVHPSTLMQPWPTPSASSGGYTIMPPTTPEHQQEQLLFTMNNSDFTATSSTMSSLSSSCSLPPHEGFEFLPSSVASMSAHATVRTHQPFTPPDAFHAMKADQQQQQQQLDLQQGLSALQISDITKGQQYNRQQQDLLQENELDNKQEQQGSTLCLGSSSVDGDEEQDQVNDDDDKDADYCEEEEGETESDDEEMEDIDDDDDDDYVEPTSAAAKAKAATAAARRHRNNSRRPGNNNNSSRSTTVKIEPSLSSSRATIRKPVQQQQQQARRPRAPRTYTRRTATSYDAETTHYLKSVFFSIYSKKDKLTKEQRKQVQTHTGLKPRNITYWFSNHKRRFQNSLYVFKQTVRESQGKVVTYDDFLSWRRQHGLPEDVPDSEVADSGISFDEGCWSSPSSTNSKNTIKSGDEEEQEQALLLEEEDQKQQNSDSAISCLQSPADATAA
ncbi:hypothetical protein BDB00DRAFT_892083 [Zychaea mexicana]|uniref:uncharacterized protein n=1 Tax=Zychaea mexicana TaxID=64656 RepID=UPI0022FEBE53|nr:uncharacterized protein BDB00DRAFT_892083 [Zychaea mexicana]KAI9484699.1 hypothetical protein BDB00DRAFT_892083 [Zychaea mexicana]